MSARQITSLQPRPDKPHKMSRILFYMCFVRKALVLVIFRGIMQHFSKILRIGCLPERKMMISTVHNNKFQILSIFFFIIWRNIFISFYFLLAWLQSCIMVFTWLMRKPLRIDHTKVKGLSKNSRLCALGKIFLPKLFAYVIAKLRMSLFVICRNKRKDKIHINFGNDKK